MKPSLFSLFQRSRYRRIHGESNDPEDDLEALKDKWAQRERFALDWRYEKPDERLTQVIFTGNFSALLGRRERKSDGLDILKEIERAEFVFRFGSSADRKPGIAWSNVLRRTL